MQGFSGNYTHSAGDRFIFKGGVTWPNSVFPFVIANSGSDDLTVDYFGVDPTWFDAGACGGMFCRPVFDMQSQVVASTNVAILVNGDYVKVDNLEITNLYWTGSAQAGAILVGEAGVRDVLSNLYIHDWTHDPAGGTQDVFHAVASTPAAQGGLYNSEVTGFPGSTNSGTGAFNIPYVSNCSIHDLSSGMVVPNGINVLLRDSRLFNINPSFDGVSPSQAVLTTGLSFILNNYVHDFTNATAGIVTQPSHSAISGDDAYYNNLIWNTGSKTPFILDTTGSTAASANPYFLNNTIVQDSNGFCVAVGKSNSGSLSGLTWENNQCISDINPATGFLCTNNLDPVNCSSYAGGDSADNLLMTHAVAGTNNYTLSDLFSPTASTSPTVGAGLWNAIVSSVGDIRGAPRPFGQPFDVGAYQYCAGCGSGPVSLPVAVDGTTNNSGTVPATINFDASHSTAPGAEIIRYDWLFGDGTSALGLTSPTTSHVYTSAGNFISSVTIKTSLWAQASGWSYIVILPRAAGLAVGSAQAQAGSDAALNVTFTPSPDIVVSGFQFDLTLPASVSYVSSTLGPVSVAAGKQLSDNPAIPRVVISGLNATPIAAGVAATVYLHLAAGISAGPIPIVLSNLIATSPNGNAVPLNGINGNIILTASPVSQVSVFAPRAYPSPWRSDRDSGIPITFDQLSGNSTIDIFTISGHLVQSLTTSNTSTTWYRTNKSGDTVASGLYFYVITNDQGQKASGKLVIIK